MLVIGIIFISHSDFESLFHKESRSANINGA